MPYNNQLLLLKCSGDVMQCIIGKQNLDYYILLTFAEIYFKERKNPIFQPEMYHMA